MPCQTAVHGAGIGLRAAHLEDIIKAKPDVDWFEILADNATFLSPREQLSLERLRENYPFSLHSVGLSLGSCEPLDLNYLEMLKNLKDRYSISLISEHLCWTSAHGKHFPDLLPLPQTEETAKHVASRIVEVQEYLGQEILIENVSSYALFKCSDMSEADFVAEVADKADCKLLLDVNNIHVSAFNLGFSAQDYLKKLPADRIAEIHLGGHSEHETHLLDSHDCEVSAEVWQLYREALELFGQTPTLIEWDNELPAFSELELEQKKAKRILNEVQ